ncbi:flavin reductase family protein [Ottowia thiooxydans]|uniref:Flavin reductase (DIM6/NTAB) family NADH-FMN oxidoreductase RutF n=1 Tax=Ottowia thiooxydans TaxID=219182 RepID=A0ABV2Q3P9_9BURK
MDDHFYSYEPAKGHGLKHDPIASILGPRPIGWISTRSTDGHANLAPYSFFNVFSYQPPIVAFASVGWKDTIRNARDTGEFVVNLATRALAERVNLTSASVPSDIDEFDLAGLAPAPCLHVSAPRVAQSPVALECRVTHLQQLAGANGVKVETWIAFAEVVAVHIASELVRDGVYSTENARPILRAGGPADYFEIGPEALFQMHRPR